jgi:hypothetical protein
MLSGNGRWNDERTVAAEPGPRQALKNRSRAMSAKSRSIACIIGVGLGLVPAMAQQAGVQQLVASAGAAGDFAGNAIAVDADVMVVGTPGFDGPGGVDQGQVVIYRWSGGGWSPESVLRASDGRAGDKFGSAVAIVGDTVVVGAFEADDAGRLDQGAAYVFTRAGSSWSQRARLVAGDGAAGEKFGACVSLTGDTVLVGASGARVGGLANAGAGYVFVREGAAWTQQAKLVATDPQANGFLGVSGVIRDDAAILGAFGVDVAGQVDRGAAYVFTREGTTWTHRSMVVDPAGAAGDQFGVSVDLDGSTAVIGAFGDDVDGRVDQGSATAFTFDAATGRCSEPLPIRDPAGVAADRFGLAIDVRGGVIAAGATGRGSERGIALLFERSASSWVAVGSVSAPDGAIGDHFGRSVAVATDSVAVGAVDDAVCGRASQGSVWTFPRFDGRWRTAPRIVSDVDGMAADAFGNSVAVEGDLMVVGVPIDAVGGNVNQGSAVVYRRGSTGWMQEARLVAGDGVAQDRFGNVVSISDGTVAVGAYLADMAGRVDQGAAYVFVKSGGSWVQQAKLLDPDGAAGDKFGNAIAIDGDRVAVSASSDTVGTLSLQGSAHVFERSAGSWTHRQRLVASDGSSNDYFGSSIAISSDTLLVGAFFASSAAGVDGGAAYVFDLAGGAWTQSAKIVQPDAQPGDFFGVSVAIDGDTAVVGAFRDDRGANSDQGSATVFLRQGASWIRQAVLLAPDGAAGDGFGIGVALSGDTCAIGAFTDDVGAATDAGEAHVFRRLSGAWSHERRFSAWADACTIESLPWVNANAGLGYALAIGDDFVAATGRGINVGANAGQGAVVVMDTPLSGGLLVSNANSGTRHGSLAAAVSAGSAGDDLVVTPAAFAAAGTVDTIGRTFGIRSTGSIRTSFGSTLSLGGGTLLAAAIDAPCEINGTLQSAAGGAPYVSASSFLLGTRGRLAAKVGTSLSVVADRVELDGTVRVEPAARLDLIGSAVHGCGAIRVDQGGSLSVDGPFRLASTLAASSDATLSFAGGLASSGTLSLTNAQLVAPMVVNAGEGHVDFSGAVSLFGPMVNHGTFNVFGSSGIFGDFTNAAESVTTIRSGTLFLFGSLENQGTILGTLCATCSGMPPGLEIGGNLILGPASNLILPYAGGVVRLGGHLDCAIDDPGRFDLSLAELVLDGSGGDQMVEAMSLDRGVDERGFSRADEGGFPLGALRVASGSVASLVDRRVNGRPDRLDGEVVYVRRLVVESGATLRTGGITIYHEDADIQGEVDDESRLVSVRPPCPADLTNDGGVDGSDVSEFFARWEAADIGADLTGDGAVDGQDVHEFFSHWEAGC